MFIFWSLFSKLLLDLGQLKYHSFSIQYSQGTAQDAWYAFDQIACWSRCKTTENCNWFSYDYDENMCSLFEICLEIDKSKLRYVSGKKECFVENTGK